MFECWVRARGKYEIFSGLPESELGVKGFH
jgi:hypothetical protein